MDFVEQLLARMCHYQHGHINAYLKPMLQRDFISLLPSKLEAKVFTLIHKLDQDQKNYIVFFSLFLIQFQKRDSIILLNAFYHI